MITQTAKAIKQKFDSSSNLQSLLSGGFYFTQAPQDVTSPWGTFMFIGSSDEEIMGASADVNLREVEIQVSLFSEKPDGGEEISLVTEIFTEVFDWTDLHVGEYSVYKVRRLLIGAITFIDETWQSNISYEIGMQKE